MLTRGLVNVRGCLKKQALIIRAILTAAWPRKRVVLVAAVLIVATSASLQTSAVHEAEISRPNNFKLGIGVRGILPFVLVKELSELLDVQGVVLAHVLPCR